MSNRIGVALLLLSSLATATPTATAAPEGGEPTLASLARDLVLEIVENGPSELWTLHVSNAGAAPFVVVADPSVLSFEVSVPGKALPVTCRLPEPLWPKTVRRRAVTLLQPGERFSRRFDPRFFCFDDMGQEVLVVGARVTPHFGWPPQTKQVRTGGKRTLVPLPPSAPYVAWLPPQPPADAAASEAPSPRAAGGAASDALAPDLQTDAAWREPAEGLKQISGPAIVLSPEYAAWAEPPAAAGGPLQLSMRAGSDAEDERSATVTLGVYNGSDRPQQIVLRRELFEYRVEGPDGPFVCGPAELGPPDHASFETLAPGASRSMIVRLVELCPSRSLSRPGVYEVEASFTSSWSGQQLGLDAFVGTLQTPAPALIRIRSGERPSFLRAAPMLPGAPGASMGPAPGQNTAPPGPEVDGPAEGGPELPADEPPADHEPPAELPQPEAPPPAGTIVE